MSQKQIVCGLCIALLLISISGAILGVFYVFKYIDLRNSPADEEALLESCEFTVTKNAFANRCEPPKIIRTGHDKYFLEEKIIAKHGHVVGLKPLLYNLHLKFPEKREFTGNLTITVKVLNGTQIIRLDVDSAALKIDWNQLRIRERCSRTLICPREIRLPKAPTSNPKRYREQFAEIVVSEPLVPGKYYEIEFPHFSGSAFGNRDQGGSWGVYLAENMEPAWAIGTIFQMRGARTAFPCFDHPSLKAKFKLCIEHPLRACSSAIKCGQINAVSNMPLEKALEHPDGRRTVCFAKTPIMSTYVFTFSVYSDMEQMESSFKSMDGTEHNLSVIVPWKRAEDEWILDEAARIAFHLSELTGLAYPLPSLAFIAVDRAPFWGIENFGLVTLDYGWMRDSSENLAHTILIHEIIHQWMGNLVTTSTWDEICLQEGFTGYITKLIAHDLKLSERDPNLELEELRNVGMGADRGRESIVQEFLVTQEIANRCFDKPSIVFKMLDEAFPGSTRFLFRGLLRKFRLRNADAADWAVTLSELDPLAGQMLQIWFTQPGFPILYAKLAGSELTVTQKMFRNNSITSVGPPFVLGLDAYPTDAKGLMAGSVRKFHVASNTDWFILNPSGLSYSLNVYDAQNYRNLLHCIKMHLDSEATCALSRSQIHNIFKDFCWALIRDEFPWNGQEPIQIWRDIFELLRTLSDVKLYGDRRMDVGPVCSCCLKTKKELEAEKADPQQRFWRPECSYQWSTICQNLRIMQFISSNFTMA